MPLLSNISTFAPKLLFMAGLYLHIPFCRSRCAYCGFFSTTLPALAPRYVEALCREMALRSDWLAAAPDTVYIGGGTPSLLAPQLLARLFASIDMSRAVEVTMECNPDDVTPSYCEAIASLPVNRVSMGAQTFSDERLAFIGRRHTARQVGQAVKSLRAAGVGNVSVDLMYGFPGETMEQWRDDVKRAIDLGADHVSAYCLSYEQGTPLYNMLRRGAVSELGEELQRAMYYFMKDSLEAAGYEHYELSNFARGGKRSRHNSAYWTEEPYLGLGAAAHSFRPGRRQWNVASVERYIEAIEGGHVPAEGETLDADTSYNDTVMLSLRTREGIDMGRLAMRHGPRRAAYCQEQAAPYVASGLLASEGQRLRLSREGLFVSDMVASDLMIV